MPRLAVSVGRIPASQRQCWRVRRLDCRQPEQLALRIQSAAMRL
jgi:hypothetical protein